MIHVSSSYKIEVFYVLKVDIFSFNFCNTAFFYMRVSGLKTFCEIFQTGLCDKHDLQIL